MALIIAANWKMHKTREEARVFCGALRAREDNLTGTEVVICPPYTALEAVKDGLDGSKFLHLGAQNIHWERQGAFTGEVSGPMLRDSGVEYVIIGHSERRHLLGETDETVRLKTRSALEQGFKVILCVGETEEQRHREETARVLENQVRSALYGLEKPLVGDLIIAYEPVWAIGTGRAAAPQDAAGAAGLIRELFAGLFGSALQKSLRIQYGGSVKPENIASFMDLPGLDGALVGGAGLEAATFADLIQAAQTERPNS